MTDLHATDLPATRSTRAADGDLAVRLSALEARAPGRDDPPALPTAGRWRRWGASMAAASFLVLVLAGTVGAGVLVVAGQQAHSAPGIENPGQPLYGADLECMTPPQAAAFLAAHGYADVVWQVESGDPGLGKAGLTSVQQASPPQHGFVVPAAVLDDGRLHMVVDQRVGAEGVGTCHGMAMP